MKTCTGCGLEKELDAFGKDAKRPGGRANRCRACRAADHQRFIRANPDYIQARNLLIRYGISPETYQEMLAQQGGGCAVCTRPPGETALCIDHDHACCPGRMSCGTCVRGLLCTGCNKGLGFFRDDPERISSACNYVVAWAAGAPPPPAHPPTPEPFAHSTPAPSARHLRHHYGIQPEEYADRFRAQGGLCAICAGTPSSRGLFVDHDHACCPSARTCGACLRGLVCQGCNSGLGLFSDDPLRLQAAIHYLVKEQ